MAIRIITDSASDITKVDAENLGIEMLPMQVQFNGKLYLDGVDLDRETFYEQLKTSKELAKTSQLIPHQFEESFEKIKKNGDKAIVIVVSSGLSGTYNNAKIAADKYEGIYVVDSLNASVGEKILVFLALQLIKEGKSFEEIIKTLEEEKHNVHFYAKLDTLKYLRKGGRISALVSIAGEALHIKPIIGIVKGAVKFIGKARGLKNANSMITKLIVDNGGIDQTKPFATVYSGGGKEMLTDYINLSKELLNVQIDVPTYSLGCTIGTHIGENGIGVAFFANKK